MIFAKYIIAAWLVASPCVFAIRTKDADGTGRENVSSAAATVDITELLDQHYKLRDKDREWRCCCDSCDWGCSRHNEHKYSGYCAIYSTNKINKCGDVRNSDWPAGAKRSLHNYPNTKRKKCTILQSDVKWLSDQFHLSADYCKQVSKTGYSVPAAALGSDAVVTCNTGYRQVQRQVACKFKKSSAGVFDPDPSTACTAIQDYCKAVIPIGSDGRDDPSRPKVGASSIGGHRQVMCSLGWIPTDGTVICSESKKFTPEPSCQKTPDYCKAINEPRFGGLQVAAAALGGHSDVRCASVGYEPSPSSSVTCEVNFEHEGAWAPKPKCRLIPEFCVSVSLPDMPGSPSTEPASYNGQSTVKCSPGYEPVEPRLTCGADRKFDMQPECVKIEEYCPSFRHTDSGAGMTATEAAKVDEKVEVTCAVGFEPEVEFVTCGTDAQFEPRPQCHKVLDWCLGRSRYPKVEDAALGEMKEVSCDSDAGSIPADLHVKCGFRNNFEPRPSCVTAPPEYCKAKAADALNLPAARFLEKVDATCDVGYELEGEDSEVTCQYSTGAQGEFVPERTCNLILDFCKGGANEEDPGHASIDSSSIGKVLNVKCNRGFDASDPATCGSDGKFQPTPSCSLTPDYCKFTGWRWPGKPSVPPAVLGQNHTVTCTAGYAPKYESVTCTENSKFSPDPACLKIPDWCKGLSSTEPGQAKTQDATVKQQVEVICADGFIPSDKYVTCGEERQFEPSPKCVEIPKDYCKAVSTEEFDVPVAQYGDVATATCKPGYLSGGSIDTKTACSYSSGTSGMFVPEPSCAWSSSFCSGGKHDLPGSPVVESAALGQKRPVTSCTAGYTLGGEVTCGENRQFQPAPKCVPLPDYCGEYRETSTSGGMPVVEGTAAMDEQKEVTCINGFESKHEFVTCSSDKSYQPKPECQKVTDWCLGKKARTASSYSVPEAAMGEQVQVTCGDGYIAVDPLVTCGYRGSFEPSPKCEAAPDGVCAVFEDPGPGSASVAQTPAGQRATVQCAEGFVPKYETTTCNKYFQFDPTPLCVRPQVCSPLVASTTKSPSAPGAALGEKVKVTCIGDMEPTDEFVTCLADGSFQPIPACQKPTPTMKPVGTCAQFSNGDPISGLPRTEETDSGEWAEVRCAPGYEPVEAWIQCTTTADGNKFVPEPACDKISDYCMARRAKTSGTAGVPDAALGEKVRVTCVEGFKPQDEFATCGFRGSWSPSPKCLAV